jgi:hypothetical protein
VVRKESPGTQLDPGSYVVSSQRLENIEEQTTHENWDSVDLEEKTSSWGVYQGLLNQLDMSEANLSLHSINNHQRLFCGQSVITIIG